MIYIKYTVHNTIQYHYIWYSLFQITSYDCFDDILYRIRTLTLKSVPYPGTLVSLSLQLDLAEPDTSFSSFRFSSPFDLLCSTHSNSNPTYKFTHISSNKHLWVTFIHKGFWRKFGNTLYYFLIIHYMHPVGKQGKTDSVTSICEQQCRINNYCGRCGSFHRTIPII